MPGGYTNYIKEWTSSMKIVKPMDIAHGFYVVRKAQRLFEARLHWIYLCPPTLPKNPKGFYKWEGSYMCK